MPAMRFRSVVFPEPDGPMSATKSPSSTVSERPVEDGEDLRVARVLLDERVDPDETARPCGSPSPSVLLDADLLLRAPGVLGRRGVGDDLLAARERPTSTSTCGPGRGAERRAAGRRPCRPSTRRTPFSPSTSTTEADGTITFGFAFSSTFACGFRKTTRQDISGRTLASLSRISIFTLTEPFCRSAVGTICRRRALYGLVGVGVERDLGRLADGRACRGSAR